jgi:hypothetical protein
MAFGITASLSNYTKQWANHLGKLSIKIVQTGAYSIDTRLNIPRLFDINNFSSGLSLAQTFVPAARMAMSGGMDLSLSRVMERFGPITACTASAAGALVTVGSGHNLISGEMVNIRQTLGSTELNGVERVISRVSDTQFLIAAITSVTGFATSADSIIEVRRPLPTLTVNAVTTAGVFTTTAAHGLASGDEVFVGTIAGLTGPTVSVSYVKQIVNTVPTTTTFTLKSLPTWTGGAFTGTTPVMIIRSLAQFGRFRLLSPKTVALASFTVASPSVFTSRIVHGLRVGDVVYVDGTLDATASTNVNGYKVVRTVPSTTTFTLESTAGAPVNVTAGTPTANIGTVSGLIEVPDTTVIESGGHVELELYPVKSKLGKGSYFGPLNA